MRPAGVLAVLMLILRFINVSPYSGDLKMMADFTVQAMVLFLLGCFFADLRDTPWSSTVEMLLVFAGGFLIVYLGNLALGFTEYGFGVLQYATLFQAAALMFLLPLPFGFALRKLSQLVFRVLIQSNEQRDPEDLPEIRPI